MRLLLAGAMLGVMALAGAAQDAPRLLLETGIRDADDVGVDRLRQLVPRVVEMARRRGIAVPAGLRDLVERALAPANLPCTLRVYVPDKAGRDPRLVAVVDTKGALPLEPGDPPAWYCAKTPLPDGQRYVLGLLEAHVAEWLPALSSPKKSERFFTRTPSHPCYAFLDLAALLPPALTTRLHAAFGPGAHLVALGLSRPEGDWQLDVHWGGRQGQGVLGASLPTAGQPSSLHQLVPFEPMVLLQVSLTAQGAAGLARMPVVQRLLAAIERAPDGSQPGGAARVPFDLGAALADWQGEAGLYQPGPVIGQQAPVLLLLRTTPERAASLAKELARDDTRTASHGGLLVVARAPEAQALVERVLALARTPQPRRPTLLDRHLAAPFQLWIAPEAMKSAFDLLGEALAGTPAVRIVPELRMLDDGLGLTLGWDREGIAMRVRF